MKFASYVHVPLSCGKPSPDWETKLPVAKKFSSEDVIKSAFRMQFMRESVRQMISISRIWLIIPTYCKILINIIS